MPSPHLADLLTMTAGAEANQAEEWTEFVSTHGAGHLLQTSEWAALKSHFGWWSRQVLLWDAAGTPRAGAQILFRKVAGQVLAYVPRGPLVDWADEGLTRSVVERISAVARQERAFVLKIEPALLDTAANRQRLLMAGFRPSPQTIQPRSTIVVDLRADRDAILARMKSKWRYNIRLAARKGVTVRELQAHELPLFQQLMAETGKRDGFSAHSTAYYQAAYERLVPQWGTFLLASYEGTPLACLAVFATGPRAWYLWGASSNRQRNLMPNYALQWEAMRWAKERGCTQYDFWGIPDEIGSMAMGLWDEGRRAVLAENAPLDVKAFPTGDLWGVFRFKQGFGGVIERMVGAWDLPLQRPIYGLYRNVLFTKEQVAKLWKPAAPERSPLGPAREQQVHLEPVATQRAWEDVLAQLPADASHVLQSWTWGAVKAHRGWTVERWAVHRGERVLGAFQFLWRQPTWMLPLRVAYVPKGPVVDWRDDEATALVLAQIEGLTRQRGCLQVKIDPDVLEKSPHGRRLQALLACRHWRFSPEQIQFKNTGFTDLVQPANALLASFKSKCRYNIRLAERRGIVIRYGSVADLTNFYELYQETSARDGFLIRPFAYYDELWRGFLSEQEDGETSTGGALLLAEHPQEALPVAGLFLLRHGPRAVYFNGASSARRRRDMPNYLLQWRALEWAKAHGCSVYDWWGAPSNPADPQDPFQGVWHFKEGFAARMAVHMGAWDWHPNPLLQHGYHWGMPLLLNLMRRRHRS